MDQTDYYWNHLPRCIAGFVAQPVQLPGVEFDGHASGPSVSLGGDVIEGAEHVNTVFLLSCTCGHDRHAVLGHYWRNSESNNVLLFLSPFALRCEACDKVTEVIDTDRHGYDAEIGAIVATVRGEGKRTAFCCTQCGQQAFQVCVRFEYSGNLLDQPCDDFRGREQDLFSWLSVIGKCPSCARLLSIADFECA